MKIIIFILMFAAKGFAEDPTYCGYDEVLG